MSSDMYSITNGVRLQDYLRATYRRRDSEIRAVRNVVCLFVIGGVLGPAVNWFINLFFSEPLFTFSLANLTTLWRVHATVITLSLIGLSFAWESIRSLVTTKEIIQEIGDRLQSSETIAFLLFSNLMIGFAVLLAPNGAISAFIGGSVSVVFVASFLVTVNRFRAVLDYSLYNTIDDNVRQFAREELERIEEDIDADDSPKLDNIERYLDHFYDNCYRGIQQGRPSLVDDSRQDIVDILTLMIDSRDYLSKQNGFWRDTFYQLNSLHQRCIDQRSSEAEKHIIRIVFAVYLSLDINNQQHLSRRTIEHYADMFVRSQKSQWDGANVGFLLDRLDHMQRRIFSNFNDSNDQKSLKIAEGHVDTIFEAHSRIWKAAVEAEDIDSLDDLHYFLNDVRELRPHEYIMLAHKREDEKGSGFLEKKQKMADEYRREIQYLRFYIYGWGYFLYRKKGLSKEFLEKLLTRFLQDGMSSNFTSPTEFIEPFFEFRHFSLEDQIEHWDLNRKMSESRGTVGTDAATSSWLLHFLCTGMVLSLDSAKILHLRNDDIQNRIPIERPQTKLHIRDIIDTLESYQDQFPLSGSIDNSPSVNIRCVVLISHFKAIYQSTYAKA